MAGLCVWLCLVPPNMDAHEIVESFNARAERYATDDWHRRYAEQLVDVTPIQPGDRVLDAGTGTGFAACAIARRVVRYRASSGTGGAVV